MTELQNKTKQNTGKYDLEERTAKFAERIIELCKKAPKTVVTIPIISQLVRAGTSVGANYCEANGASSKYWLRMLVKAADELKEECRELWQEAQELTLIFSKIAGSSK